MAGAPELKFRTRLTYISGRGFDFPSFCAQDPVRAGFGVSYLGIPDRLSIVPQNIRASYVRQVKGMPSLDFTLMQKRPALPVGAS